MRKTATLILTFLLCCNVAVFAQQMTSEQYIAKYKSLAIESMIKYNIPASIKLAQGLVETASGNSRLAKEANNHFGIKCKSYWKGETISHDDDAKGECFRKYNSASDSYIDHSEFLTNSERYNVLFTYDPTDYKSWAKGLSACGYATNPKYPLILIKAIEDYELYLVDDEALELKERYENGDFEEEKVEEAPAEKPEPQVVKPAPIPADLPVVEKAEPVVKMSKKEQRRAAKEAKKKAKNQKSAPVQQTSTPKSLTSVSMPLAPVAAVSGGATSSAMPVSQPKEQTIIDKIVSNFRSSDGVALSNNIYSGPKFDTNGFIKVNSSVRDVYKYNNVLLTIAGDGETFETIGAQMNISPARLMAYNEVKGSNIRIEEGSVVYLSTKGAKVRNGFSVHTVVKGETLHHISQTYGVKMASLAKLNGFSVSYNLSVGQRVRLK